jgi:hypothetical protein
MKLIKLTLMLAVGVGPVVGLGSGCSNQDEIPLAKVSSPPPLPAQNTSKLKTPPGASPSVLPQ